MIESLAADGPHDGTDDAMLFGRLVGSWDLDMTAHESDGTTRRFQGEWRFGWVLQGRAVQDVLITRSLEGEVVGYGSTIRSFDPGRRLWWVVWQDPMAGEFSVLLARPEDDRIVMDGQWTIAEGDLRFRWTFSEITAESFLWEAEISEDGGNTWRLKEEIRARRRDRGAGEAGNTVSASPLRAGSENRDSPHG
jgi:hypothetical protein